MRESAALCVNFGVYACLGAVMRIWIDLCVIGGIYALLGIFMRDSAMRVGNCLYG